MEVCTFLASTDYWEHEVSVFYNDSSSDMCPLQSAATQTLFIIRPSIMLKGSPIEVPSNKDFFLRKDKKYLLEHSHLLNVERFLR